MRRRTKASLGCNVPRPPPSSTDSMRRTGWCSQYGAGVACGAGRRDQTQKSGTHSDLSNRFRRSLPDSERCEREEEENTIESRLIGRACEAVVNGWFSWSLRNRVERYREPAAERLSTKRASRARRAAKARRNARELRSRGRHSTQRGEVYGCGGTASSIDNARRKGYKLGRRPGSPPASLSLE